MAEISRRKPLKVVFRVDGGGPVGFGHISRCSSLAKALSRHCAGPSIEFWCRESTSLSEFLSREGFGYNPIPVPEDEESTKINLNKCSPDILIMDIAEHIPDLAFDGWSLIEREYSGDLAGVASVSLQIDDFAKGNFSADIILNGGVVDQYTKYDESNSAELLTGPGFVLLRPEFSVAHRRMRKASEKIKKILIVDCGNRFTHHIPVFLYAFEEFLDSPEIHLVSSEFAANPNRMNSALNVKLVPSVRDMAAAMLDCDIAVTGGGTILYELACVGTPAISMPAVDHQEIISQTFHDIGTVLNVGPKPDKKDIDSAVRSISESAGVRSDMMAKGKSLVDGLGADRVAKRILEKLENRS